jgi:hypothetical protein
VRVTTPVCQRGKRYNVQRKKEKEKEKEKKETVKKEEKSGRQSQAKPTVSV